MGRLAVFETPAILALALSLGGCMDFYKEKPGYDLPQIDAASVSYSVVRSRIFVPRCIACHGTKGGVSFETYDSTKSALHRLEKAAIQDRIMPPSGPLRASEIRLLTAWIEAGAPESVPGENPPVEEPIEPTFSSIKKHVFEVRCFACHKPGGEGEKVPLQTRDDLLHSARDLVIPGNSEESWLNVTISRDDDKRMPPPKTGAKLKEVEIQAIRKWIDDGAQDN